MNNFDDPFEAYVRGALESQDVKYNPDHWNELEQKLNFQNVPVSRKSKLIQKKLILKAVISLIVASFISIIAFDYFSKEGTKKEHSVNDIKNQSEPAIGLQLSNTANDVLINGKNTDSISSLNSIEVIGTIHPQEDLASSITEKAPTKKNSPSEEVAPSLSPSEIVPSENIVENNSAKPSLAFTIGLTTGCEKLLTNFTIKKPDKNYIYKWELGDGTFLEGINPQHLFTSSGVYDVKLMAESKLDHRKYINNLTSAVVVYKKPKADFEWNYLPAGSFNIETNFLDRSEDAVEWIWKFGNKNQSLEQNPKHYYSTQGNKEVKLIVKNIDGCSDTALKIISIENNNPLLAPNSFTPDGDGINDKFIPKALEISDQPFEMSVFDRAGHLVYKTNDKNKPWDGKTNSGEVYQTGSIFMWSVKIRDSIQTEQNYIGKVSIVKSN